MGNYNGWQGNFLPSVEATIAAGDTDSSVIELKGLNLVGVILPSIFTGTALSILVGDSSVGYQARGEILFGSNPANADTLTINGVVITFVTGSPGANEVHIGADATATMVALQAFLDATEDAALLALTYSSVGTLMTVVAVAHGTAGNAYTFAKSSSHITLTPSGGTLTGGGFRALYNESNAAISFTVAAGRAYSFTTPSTQGFAFMKLKSGTTEANGRTLICSLKGL